MSFRQIAAALLAATAIWVAAERPAQAQVGGISYTLTPVLEGVFF